MSRIASIWTGLLKAGALALVLALFGFATASAHDMQTDHRNGVTVATHHADPAPSVLVAATGCHQHLSASADHAHPAQGDGAGGDCCKDICACGCAMTCTAHLHIGLSGIMAVVLPVPAAPLLPGRAIDPAGLTTPPDPRPPLSI
ncbi:hypothetical protein [Niveispirillum sp. KHB5.9]|uniref:hypothetical protein n=1 Tax=Niveispirillum sp. KHB5.9 TaxID=3400269 RepID=UPI003A843FE6